MNAHEHAHLDHGDEYETGSLTLAGSIAMGTGVMIGAGIFALTGQVAQLTGALFPLAFVAASLIVAFSAYSYIKVCNKYPSAGGIAMTPASLRWLPVLYRHGHRDLLWRAPSPPRGCRSQGLGAHHRHRARCDRPGRVPLHKVSHGPVRGFIAVASMALAFGCETWFLMHHKDQLKGHS